MSECVARTNANCIAFGWKMFRLSDLAQYHNGVAFKPADWVEDGLPIIRIEQLNNPNGEFDRYAGLVSEINRIRDGDLVFSWSATLKVVIWRHGDAVLNQHLFKVVPKPGVDLRFLHFTLDSNMEALGNNSHGSTMKHIKRTELDKFVVKVPELELQRKIATILTTIDATIEQTEALIEKYQHIKAGLMHDLFTRGVLPNGQLRPPRDQAPELYQETTIGWIPKEWEVAALATLLAPVPNNIRSGPFGSALLKHELVEEGIPFLGIDNIHVERFSADFQRFVSERKFRELARYRVRPGDVVITIMGTVGRCCVVPAAIEIALSSKHLWTMTFDTERVVPELVCWQLNHAAWAKAWFRKSMQGGIMDAIQSSTLKTLVIPLPPLAEQVSIQVRFQQVTNKINQDREQLQKLKKQKLGLMQDLLTGKVAVKVDSPDNIAAHA